jgi:hypothetical protein
MRARWILYVLCVYVLIGLISGCCHPPKISSVPIDLIPQNRDWWCWAATTEMVSEYYGHRVLQCESANYVKGTPPDCCTGCTGNCGCWGPGWGVYVNEIKDNWTHWNFSYTYKESNLTWEELKETVSMTSCCGKCPIYALIPGHVVVIYGYAEIGADKYVSYRDPWPPDCEKNNGICSSKNGGEDVVSTYDAFVNIDGWWGSFYNFKYTGS